MLIKLFIKLCIFFVPTLLPIPCAAAVEPFRVALSKPLADLHPLRSRDPGLREIKALIFEGLLKFDLQSGEFVPGLAASYQWLDEGKRLRFHLRENVEFHSGQTLSAEDVESTFRFFLKGWQSSKWRSDYYQNVDRIQVVNPLCIDFYLKNSHPLNLEVIASVGYSPIFSKSLVASAEGQPPEDLLIGTGPYVFDSFRRDQKIQLKKFERWWGRGSSHFRNQFKFERIEFRLISDAKMQVDYLKSKKLDYLPHLDWKEGLSLSQKKQSTIKLERVKNKAPKGYTFIAWNLKSGMFASWKTREALSLLFPRREVVDKIFQGTFEEVHGPWFNESELSPENFSWNYDPLKAKNLLAEDGWKMDVDSSRLYRIDKNAERIPFVFELLYAGEEPEAYLTLYQAELQKVGVFVRLKKVEAFELQGRATAQKFEAVHLAWGIRSQHWQPRAIWYGGDNESGSLNFIGYSNEEVNSLIDSLDRVSQQQQRQDILKRVFKKIVADQPYLFLFQPKEQFFALSERVKIDAPTKDYGVDWTFWEFH